MVPNPSGLLNLEPGKYASIYHLDALSPLLQRRLADMGLYEGTRVSIARYSPFGGPVTIQFGDGQIGLRKSEAAKIEVLVS